MATSTGVDFRSICQDNILHADLPAGLVTGYTSADAVVRGPVSNHDRSYRSREEELRAQLVELSAFDITPRKRSDVLFAIRSRCSGVP